MLEELSAVAWSARSHAKVYGGTKVGCADLSASGQVYVGCNVEHRFRSHDIHAEVNAIGAMVATGDSVLTAILVVAERERFTPCGACMDWIFELAGPDCLVGFQPAPGAPIQKYTAHELMPSYPL